jgi:hypothetical protein
MATCVFCGDYCDNYKNLIEYDGCICRACDTCKDNFKKYGAIVADKIVMDNSQIDELLKAEGRK